MAAIGVRTLYRGEVVPWMYTWGATDDEVADTLPGDDLVDADTPRTTRAIAIDAPASEVWPWLAQIGEDRAGFYSYSVLERMVGASIHNASAIHPEWQDLSKGDTVWLARRFGDRARQVVAAIEPGTALALVSPPDFDHLCEGRKATGAWCFVLREKADGTTRLLARGSGGAVGRATFDIIHFVMERAMMRGIRRRAEASLGHGGSPRTSQMATDTASAATHANTTAVVSP
ncbi:hypothetical protein [Mycolicibacterium lacusdiani]|uniref:hypothetical protein n=1 Tax=Mycolicibacterium lacusdiani TaxID=2895283 RepID=UPI001F3A630C|nr:hypothetical protein [Mycolicibacterium lacusdiani]